MITHQYPDFGLTMHSYICELNSKELALNEHISSHCLKINELNSLDWAAANILIVNNLIANGSV